MTSTSLNPIRELNDAFRTRAALTDWHITDGIESFGPIFVGHAVAAVRSFDAFTPDNDPYGEHDFGAFNVAGNKLFWKIDYYSRDLTSGSEDPSDPAKTRRVMTIMLASEY